MLSAFKYQFDIDQIMLSKITEKRSVAPKQGETLKLYVPALMQKLSMSVNPVPHNAACAGPGAFINDGACKPPAKSVIPAQSYITATMENNSRWKKVLPFRYKFRDASPWLTGHDTHVGLPLVLTEKYKEYYWR